MRKLHLLFLLCAIVAPSAHAQICPAGKVPEWTIYQLPTGGMISGCVQGDKSSDPTFMGACFKYSFKPTGQPNYTKHTQFTLTYPASTQADYRQWYCVTGTTSCTTSYTAKASLQCLDQPECPTPAGQWFQGMVSRVAANDECYQGCNVEWVQTVRPIPSMTGASALWQLKSKGTVCTAQADPPVEPAQCQMINGRQVCRSENPDCMQVDGEEVCINHSGGVCAAGECLTDTGQVLDLPDGSQVTKDPTATPPAPDTGTPGDAAQPDMQISGRNPGVGEEPDQYNYYNSTTVQGSTTSEGGGTTGGDPGGDPGDCEEGDPDCGEGPGGQCDPNTEDCGQCEDDPETPENDCGSGAEFTAPRIKYEYSNASELIAAKRSEISQFIADARTEAAQMLGPVDNLAGGGSQLPCWQGDFLGNSFAICPRDYSDELAIIGTIMMLLAALMSAFILLR